MDFEYSPRVRELLVEPLLLTPTRTPEGQTYAFEGESQAGRRLAEKVGLPTNVARPEGLEPPAYRFEACRSIQLSYGRVRPDCRSPGSL